MALTGERSASASITGLLLASIVAFSGCHEVTEYSDTGEFGAVILNASNLSVEGNVSGLEGARCLLSMDEDNFLVGSSSGRLYVVDSQGLGVQSSHQITAGSGAGVLKMLSLGGMGSIYVITGMGSLLEVDRQSFSVVDEFGVGSSPSDMCRSPSGAGRIYVTDQEQGRLYEVYTSDNSIGWNIPLSGAPMAVAPLSSSPDFLIAASSSGGMSSVDLGLQYRYALVGGSFSDVASLPWDSLYCAVAPCWDDDGGYLILARQKWQESTFFHQTSLPGHPSAVCATEVPSLPYFYAACATDDGTLVAAVDYRYGTIAHTAELEGRPWAIITHAGGESVVVLTSK